VEREETKQDVSAGEERATNNLDRSLSFRPGDPNPADAGFVKEAGRGKEEEMVELGTGIRDSGGGGGHFDLRVEQERFGPVMPTGGQVEENTDCPPEGKAKKLRKPRAKKNLLMFKLPTSGQKKGKGSKQKTSPKLPTGGQEAETEWLKTLLPTAKTGDWWEAPADDKGLKIKYRWRAGGQKHAYVFKRLGKRDIQTLREQPYDRQVWIIEDRILGELRAEGRTDITARLSPRPLLNRVAGAEN
jgi:hypothetical protein